MNIDDLLYLCAVLYTREINLCIMTFMACVFVEHNHLRDGDQGELTVLFTVYSLALL